MQVENVFMVMWHRYVDPATNRRKVEATCTPLLRATIGIAHVKGPSINDVTQNLRDFGPPPPLVTHSGLIHSTKSTQPPLLHHVLDNPPPPSHA